MTGQVVSVGKTPTISEVFVGALLYCDVDAARSVLRFVEESDVDGSAAAVLGAIRALALRGTPPSPQLVADDLRRRGKYTKTVAVWLAGATTSGACAEAVKDYAAALVAASYRRKVKSLGRAMTSMADNASEEEIAEAVARSGATIAGVGARLAELRGDV